MTLNKDQASQNHAGAGQAAAAQRGVGLIPGTDVRIHSTFTVSRNGESLMGYALEDGTFACIMDNKMQTFENIPHLWREWDKRS